MQVNSPEIETSSWMRQSKKSRKSLAFTGESGSMSTLPEKEEEMLRRLNVDDLPQTGLQVKSCLPKSLRECYCKNSGRRSNQKTG